MRREVWMALWLGVFMAAMMLDVRVASAAVFADFSPTRHERFLVGDPVDPDALNPTFLLDHSLITGVGLTSAFLISPQHYITATHVGVTNPTFVAADGTRHTYTAQTSSKTVLQTTLKTDLTLGNGTVLPAGSVRASDLSIIRLINPISAADGINPMHLFGGNSSRLSAEDIVLFTQANEAGSDTPDLFTTVELNTGAITESVIYHYDNRPGLPASDELHFTFGDSGHASVAEINGQIALVGIHMGISDGGPGNFYSFDSFVMPYLDQIQQIVALDGFQLKVVAVPEPGPVWLIAGVVLLVARRIRKHSESRRKMNARRACRRSLSGVV